MSLSILASITADMAREMAVSNGVCIRPILRRVLDRDTGTEARVPIACGSTREAVCPPCARKAMVLRMQQCAEGWHRDTEPDQPDHDDSRDQDQTNGQDQDEDDERVAAGPVHPAPAGHTRSAPGADGGADGRSDLHRQRRQAVPALDVPHLDPALLRAGPQRRTGRPRQL